MDEEEPIDEEGEGTTDKELVSTDKGQTGEGPTDEELAGEEIPRDEVNVGSLNHDLTKCGAT